MEHKFSDIEFTVFDVETTGLSADSGDRVVEIAAIRIKNKRRLGVFHSLINPGERKISPAAFSVNQITDDMLRDAPSAEDVFPDFLEFIDGSCLSAYNARFDAGFLLSELTRIKRTFPEHLLVLDIMVMAKKLVLGLQRYALWFVANSLGVNVAQEHRALSDVQLTVDVFNQLSNILIEKKIVSFEQVISLFGLESQLLYSLNNAKVASIQKALDLGITLKIRYFSGQGAELTEREVIPREIIYDKNCVYLVGFCKLRQQERNFKIENILHLEMGQYIEPRTA